MAKKNKNMQNALSELGTQIEAAEKLGVTQHTVSRYINGINIPSHKVLLKISTLTGYLPEKLMPDEDWQWLYDFIEWYEDN